MTEAILLWILAMVLVFAGVAGLVLPALPGAPLLFGGLYLAAWAEDFQFVGTKTLVLLGVIAGITYMVDFAATAWGAKKYGASRRAVVGAVMGAVIGIFFGLPGILFGPFVGAVIGQLAEEGCIQNASRVGFGTWIGLLAATAIKLAAAFTMIGVFIVVRFWVAL